MTAWISPDDVATWLGSQIDSVTAAILADAASEAVRNHLDRDLALQTAITESYDSNGTDYVLLNTWPVRSVSAVSLLNKGTVPLAVPGTAGYRLDAYNQRKLSFVGYGKLAPGPMTITVTYSAGYDLTKNAGSATGLPADVYLALKLTANAMANAQAADTNLSSESTAGVFSGSFYPTGVGAVPPGARTLLFSYQRVAP